MNDTNPNTSTFKHLCKVVLSPFKANWTESLHFVVIALGIITSGFWAYHTFDILSQKDVAEANLAKTNSDLDKAKLELKELRDKIDGTISSDISINVEQHSLNNNKVGLIINVHVKNNGTQDIDMTWKDTPLRVYKVAHKGDLVANREVLKPYLYRSLKTTAEEDNVSVSNLYLFVGAKKNLSFFVEAEVDNLYYITFEAKADAVTNNNLNEHGKTGVWLSSVYHFAQNKGDE
ncbi:hypothetical protein A9257_20785 [Vibrio cyclitrophicus]|uniref:hypothetical protein n=1 Tax=Vibrio cyclitrophicus TaxID=47951 RepID=UPI0007EE9D1A|nr:hypothetical protein [Vibrio cyclitrophicus]OBT02701.1 hypothetical protein A9257_20785 [Vibrio cyclitrophicus]